MMRRRGEGADPVDKHVGGRLRQRRVLLGLSQEALGDRLGLSFQQVQKYERGANRISASRLYELARILDVPVGFFFDGLPAAPGDVLDLVVRDVEVPGCSSTNCCSVTEAGPALGREALKLVGAYYRVRPPRLRKKLLALIRVLGNGAAGSQAEDANSSRGRSHAIGTRQSERKSRRAASGGSPLQS